MGNLVALTKLLKVHCPLPLYRSPMRQFGNWYTRHVSTGFNRYHCTSYSIWSSLKTGQADPAGTRKNCPRYHCSWHWSIFSLQYRYNDHIWQTQPVSTLLRALKGQTLAPFNLGWRLPFRFFYGSKQTHKNRERIEIHVTWIVNTFANVELS